MFNYCDYIEGLMDPMLPEIGFSINLWVPSDFRDFLDGWMFFLSFLELVSFGRLFVLGF
jgi:hypothetical protein